KRYPGIPRLLSDGRSSRWEGSACQALADPWLRPSLQSVARFGKDLSAVHDQGLTCNKASLVGRQKEGRIAHVFRFTQFADRNRLLHTPKIVRTQIGQSLGADVTRQDGVDRDAVRGEPQRRRAQEAEHACLGGTVVRPAGKAGDRASDGRGQYDAAIMLGFHPDERRLHGEERALQIDGLHLVPVGLGHDLDAGGWENAGIAYEDVKPAETIHRFLGECLRIGPSRNIGPAEVGFTTGPTYFLHDSVAGPRVATNDQHPGSLGGENLGDTFADASTGAGDNRSLGVQSTSHL